MGRVAEALGELEEDARSRVLRWAAERYGVTIKSTRDRSGDTDRGRPESDSTVEDGEDAEKALVASYWVQVIKAKASFGSRELNRELKDLGHAVSAINKAMIQNMKKKPAVVLQVSRGGGSPQAQKKYKLSDAGKKWVEARIG